jgi:hypothetical protein
MKKYLLLFLSILTVAGVGITLSSCESDDPPPNPKVNFARATRTLAESAGTLEVEVTLDRASDKSIIIEYDLDGTAVEGTDYEIPVDIGEVVIPAGATTGVFEIVLTNDNIFEPDETIELRISDAPENVQVGETDEMVITITEDDSKPEANFTVTSMTVNEADGLLELEVTIDSEAGQDLVIAYELSGTAVDSLRAWDDDELSADYYINGVSGELEIPEGETSATISLQLYTDFIVESTTVPETIVITLKDNDNAQAGSDDVLTINLKQQDGRAILLEWEATGVDMDLFYWIGDFGADPQDLGTMPAFWSTSESTVSGELVFIPDNLPELMTNGATADATFGVSYNYYSGTVSPMTFDVTFVDIVNGLAEAEASRDHFSATYTTININPWYENETNPLIVQTFDKDNGAYVNVSDIVVPDEGSRVRTSPFPKNAQRTGIKRSVLYQKPSVK